MVETILGLSLFASVWVVLYQLMKRQGRILLLSDQLQLRTQRKSCRCG